MMTLAELVRLACSSLVRRRHAGPFIALALMVPLALCLVLVVAFAPALDAASRVPVAVVNLDEGARDASGRKVAYGEDFVDSLLDTEDLAWDAVDEDAAASGLADGTYALVLTIPADYSEKVASAGTDDPQQADITIASSGAGNVLATETASAALRQVQSRLKSDLGEHYIVSVLSDVRGQASKLTLASDGAVMLDDAYTALSDGAGAIGDALGETASGTDALTSGLDQIAQGVTAAGTGADAVASGLDATSEQGVSLLAQGATALSQGLDGVSTATTALGGQVSGVGDTLMELTGTLSASAQDLGSLGKDALIIAGQQQTLAAALGHASGVGEDISTQADAMVRGATAAEDGVSAVANDAASLATELSNEDDAAPGIKQQLAQIDEQYEEVSGTLNDLTGRLAELVMQLDGQEAGDTDAAASAEGIAAELTALSTEIAQAQEQLTQLDDERAALIKRVDTAATNAETLSASASSANEGLADVATAHDKLEEVLAGTEAQDGFDAALAGVQQSAGSIASTAVSMGETGAAAAGTVAGVLANDADPMATLPMLAIQARELGKGVTTIGEQLDTEGAIGGGAAGIATGAGSLGQALGMLADASSAIGSGNRALGQALSAVSQGASGLGTGLSAMSGAQDQIASGIDQLADASQGVTDAVADAADVLGSATSSYDERADVAANPVRFRMSEVHVASAPAALAPACLATAVWVGAMLAMLIVPMLDARAVWMGRGLIAIVSTGAVYAGFALAQAAVMGVVCIGALGLPVADPGQFWLLLATGSLAASSIAFALRACAPRAAVPIMLGALVVQLLVAGVILPSYFTDGLSSALGGVLPLSVLSDALRSAMAGQAADATAMGALFAAIAVPFALVAGKVLRGPSARPERLAA